MESIAVIIVAGGSGSRCGGSLPKQFRLLGGLPVLARTINNFAAALPGAQLVVVLPREYVSFWQNFAARFEVAKHSVTEGGAERFHSVRLGLASVGEGVELIAVQDAVRPLASVELIRRVTDAAAEHGAAIPVATPADSFRQVEGEASHPIDRTHLRIVQTPQVFRAAVLRHAYEAEYTPSFTDDASVVEQSGCPVALVEGEASNLKITTAEDLLIAEALIAPREQAVEDEALQ